MALDAKIVLGCALLVGSTVAACARSELDRGSRTTTTSARMPRPDATAATSRTIDNAGFVDNAGRTGEMTSRSEASGMRATEAGSERPTGTPGSGTPVPIGPAPPPHAASGEGAGAASSVRGTTGPAPSGGPVQEAIARIARARCDGEIACERIGEGRAFASQEMCMVHERSAAQTELEGARCTRGVDGTQLGSCLHALRTRACDAAAAELDALPGCRLSALCSP